MNQLDEMTQKNALSAREISSNNMGINEMADVALDVTEELRQMVMGKNHDPDLSSLEPAPRDEEESRFSRAA